MRPALSRAILLFAFCAVALPSQAQQTVWKLNIPLGDWFIANNWSAGVPTSTSSAIFGNPNADGALITVPGAQAQSVFVGVITTGAGGAFRGNKGSLTVAAPGGGGIPGGLTIGDRLVIGQANATAVGEGTVNISGGANVVASQVEVGITSNGPFGTLNIADPSSFLSTTRFTLGHDTGHATLNIQNGGALHCTEAYLAGSPYLPGGTSTTAVATVNGLASAFSNEGGFVVGYRGNASLTISNDGAVGSGESSIATLAGSTGAVTVTDRGYWDALGNIFVSGWSGSTASGGSGSLRVFNGGLVRANMLKVFSTGFAQIDNGSTTQRGLVLAGNPPAHTAGGSFGDILVGQNGSGRMEILTGGVARGNRGYIGFAAGSNGAVLISGESAAASLWDCAGSVWVGNGGNGTLEVRNGGRVNSKGNGYVAFGNNTTGYALISGANSLWAMDFNLYIGGNAAAPGGNGTLQIENSGRVWPAMTTLYNTGTLALGANPELLGGTFTILGGSILAVSNTDFTTGMTLGAGGVHVLTNFFDVTFSGLIQGSGALDKGGSFTSGPGTLSLTAANTYTGGTTVSAGRLLANNLSNFGSATGSGPVTVNTTTGNTVLGGSGRIEGPVTINANSILLGGRGIAASGALTVANNLTLNPGARIQLVLGSSGAHSTITRAAGTWNFPSNLAFRFIAAGAQPGFYDNIITGLTSDPGNVGTWTIDSPGFIGTFSYDGAGNIDLTLTDAPAPTVCAWSSAAPYPIPIVDQAMAAIGDVLYSFSGVSNIARVANSYKFEGANWTPIAPLPEALENPVAVSDGTYVYVIGGIPDTGPPRTSLYRYDPVSDTYATLAPCATGTWASGAAFLNGKIYKVGGYTDLNGVPTAAVEVYNIATDSWSPAAALPLPNGLLAVFARNGFIYAAGGQNYTTNTSTAKTYRYDPGTNSWSDGAIADLPAARWGAVTLLSSDGPVMAGGYVGGTTENFVSSSVLRWNAGTNTWSALPDLLQRRARGAGAVRGSTLGVIGGRDGAGNLFAGTSDHQVQDCPAFTFTVTTLDDHNDGACSGADCTLREAIIGANARFGPDTVVFGPGVTGTIQLASALPDLSSLTIQGPGAGLLTVRRNSGANYRIFSVPVGASVTLSSLTIADGRATGTFPAGCGGGIYADHSTVNLVNVAMQGNTAAIHGGAIFNAQSTIAISNSTLNANSASASGGAIFNYGIGASAVLSLTNCTVHQNSASQYGGAIYNDGTGGGNASLTITNCTFNQNTATLIAGGIYNDALNPGSSGTATLHIGNTVLKSGASGVNLVNDGATLVSDGHNLSSDDAGGWFTADGDIVSTDPQVASLTNNGGATATIALNAGSPAIDAGDDTLAPSGDQRGYARSGPSDIGAFEFNGAAVPVSLLGIVSSKAHGGAGIFEINLQSGSPAVECRSGGAGNNQTVIFRFANEVLSVGGASLTGVGTISSAAIGTNPHEYVVQLSGVANAQTIGLALANVNDAVGGHSDQLNVSMGVLLGDTTGNGTVTASDIGQTKSQSGQPLGAASFRSDVNANGAITSSDIGQVKAQSGTQLP
jgi:CSLREA domain-containing protein